MALSGSISTNKYSTSSHGTIGLNLSWTATQSIVNNKTTISWTLKSNGSMSSGYYVQAGPVTVKIGGTTVLNTTSRFSMHGGGGYKKTGTITVSHNQDGSKSVAMSVRAAIYSASVNCTASKTFTLNKIPRNALLVTAPDFNDETNPTITYSNLAGSSVTTNLKVRITWNNGGYATNYQSLSAEGGTYTMNISAFKNAMLSAAANSKTLAVQYDLQSTINGTDYHDYKDATMSIINANPTPGAVTYQDTNSTVTGITGSDQTIVQSQSTLRIHVAAATPKKNATISSYKLNFNGTNYTPNGSGNVDIVKPNYSGTFTATATVTDSRGNTATSTKSIPITAWKQPSAKVTLSRVNGYETDCKLKADGTISTVPGSSMNMTEEHQSTGGAWIGPNALPDNTEVTIQLDNTKEGTVKVKVWDSFTVSSPTVYTLTVGKGIPICFFDVDKLSVGVYGFPDANNQLFVGGIVKCDDLDMTPKNYSYLVSVTKTSGAWSNTQRLCYRYGNMVFLRLRFQGDGTTVNKGSDAFKGTISMPYLNPHGTTAVHYVSGATVLGFIGPDGIVTVHITGDNATLAANGTIDLRFNYMYY